MTTSGWATIVLQQPPVVRLEAAFGRGGEMTVEQIQAFCRREGVRLEIVGSLAGVSWLIDFDWEGRFSVKSVGLAVPALRPAPQQILDEAASVTVTWWNPAGFDKVLEASITKELT